MNEQQPKVSVLMIAYNHEQFIAQAIESALMQRTDFPFEIVIGEDCSTDRTREIVLDFQSRYPDIIRALLPEKNLGMHENFFQTLKACRGQYVALLEGDDYWISPDKLEFQVRVLEDNPNFSMCFHPIYELFEDGTMNPNAYPSEDWQRNRTLEDLLDCHAIPTCSVVFRNHLIKDFPGWMYDLRMSDWPLSILLAQFGDISCIKDVMGVYRKHSQGACTSVDYIVWVKEEIKMQTFVNDYFGGRYKKIIKNSMAGRFLRLARDNEKINNTRQSIKYMLLSLIFMKPDFRLYRYRLFLLFGVISPRAYLFAKRFRRYIPYFS